jgi:hypothetical protein
MSPRDELDPDDRVKLATWYHLTMLLDDYYSFAYHPMYQRGLKVFASAEDKEIRRDKLKALLTSHKRLVAKWEKELGKNWRDALFQQD